MRNSVGIYYAYWTHDWDADFVPFVHKAADLGFDILEVNSGTVTNMSNAERDRLRHAAEERGIELTFCIGLTKEYDVASADESVRRNGISFLKEQAEMLAYMEAKELAGIIHGCWPAAPPEGETDRRPYLDRSVSSMREVMKVAEDRGVRFSVEVVNRFEQFLLDTFHMNIEEDSFHDAIATAGDKLGHLHTGETNRRAPGRGRIPWREVAGGPEGDRLPGLHRHGAVSHARR